MRFLGSSIVQWAESDRFLLPVEEILLETASHAQDVASGSMPPHPMRDERYQPEADNTVQIADSKPLYEAHLPVKIGQ